MIIQSKPSCMENIKFNVYEPIDEWILNNNILSEFEIQFNEYFNKKIINVDLNNSIIIEYLQDDETTMELIKTILESKETCPKIIIKINKSIKPSIVLLKYFTIIH